MAVDGEALTARIIASGEKISGLITPRDNFEVGIGMAGVTADSLYEIHDYSRRKKAGETHPILKSQFGLRSIAAGTAAAGATYGGFALKRWKNGEKILSTFEHATKL